MIAIRGHMVISLFPYADMAPTFHRKECLQRYRDKKQRRHFSHKVSTISFRFCGSWGAALGCGVSCGSSSPTGAQWAHERVVAASGSHLCDLDSAGGHHWCCAASALLTAAVCRAGEVHRAEAER